MGESIHWTIPCCRGRMSAWAASRVEELLFGSHARWSRSVQRLRLRPRRRAGGPSGGMSSTTTLVSDEGVTQDDATGRIVLWRPSAPEFTLLAIATLSPDAVPVSEEPAGQFIGEPQVPFRPVVRPEHLPIDEYRDGVDPVARSRPVFG